MPPKLLKKVFKTLLLFAAFWFFITTMTTTFKYNLVIAWHQRSDVSDNLIRLHCFSSLFSWHGGLLFNKLFVNYTTITKSINFVVVCFFLSVCDVADNDVRHEFVQNKPKPRSMLRQSCVHGCFKHHPCKLHFQKLNVLLLLGMSPRPLLFILTQSVSNYTSGSVRYLNVKHR